MIVFLLDISWNMDKGNLLKGIDNFSVVARSIHRELEQMELIRNFQVPAEGLELVILLHTQY